MADNGARPVIPSLTPAFARALRGRAWALFVLAVVVFAMTCGLLLHRHRRQTLFELATTWRAALQSHANADIHSLFDQYRATHSQLLGVAQWPIEVAEPRVYPDDLALRLAVQDADQSPGEVRIMSARDGGNRQLLATTVFVPGAVAAPAGKMAIVLQAPSLLTPWLLSTLVFAIFIFVAVQSGAAAIIRWFHLRIAEPLRDAADPEGSLSRVSEDATTAGPNDGFLAQTVESYRGLARELARTRTQLRRMENEVDEKIRVHQEGFHRQLRRAEDKALIDPLTRLHNRAFMESELERLYDEQKSRKHDLSVVMIDVDHFKYHNDTQGHKAGDDVLRFIGDLLRGATRPTDRCIRYGGDEFIMLLPGCSAKSAAEIAERIIRMFGQFASTLKSAKPPSMSAGIASLATDPSTTGHELLGFADRNLYAVKRKGKNAVALST